MVEASAPAHVVFKALEQVRMDVEILFNPVEPEHSADINDVDERVASTSATAEDVRLACRLRSSLMAVLNVLSEDDKRSSEGTIVKLVLGEKVDYFAPFSMVLKGCKKLSLLRVDRDDNLDETLRMLAAKCCRFLAKRVDKGRLKLLKVDVIHPLVDLLSPAFRFDTRAAAAITIGNLACNTDGRLELIQTRGDLVDRLVDLLRVPLPNPLKGSRRLSEVNDITANDDSAFVMISELHENSAGALWNLMAGNDPVRGQVLDSGAVPFLVDMLKRKIRPDSQELAAGALQNITLVGDRARAVLALHRGVETLVEVLSSPNPEARGVAAACLQNLAVGCNDMKLKIVAADAIPKLIPLLGTSNTLECRIDAMGALWNLMSRIEVHKEMAFKAGAVEAIFECLLEDELVEHATGALWSIVLTSDSVRKRMVDLGTVSRLHNVLGMTKADLSRGSAIRIHVMAVIGFLSELQESWWHIAKAGFIPDLLEFVAEDYQPSEDQLEMSALIAQRKAFELLFSLTTLGESPPNAPWRLDQGVAIEILNHCEKTGRVLTDELKARRARFVENARRVYDCDSLTLHDHLRNGVSLRYQDALTPIADFSEVSSLPCGLAPQDTLLHYWSKARSADHVSVIMTLPAFDAMVVTANCEGLRPADLLLGDVSPLARLIANAVSWRRTTRAACLLFCSSYCTTLPTDIVRAIASWLLLLRPETMLLLSQPNRPKIEPWTIEDDRVVSLSSGLKRSDNSTN